METLPDDESRTVTLDGGGVRLQTIKQMKGGYLLHFVRIKMDVEPKKARLRGQVENILLGNDEGLGELTSAFYSPAAECLLLIERNGTVGTGLFGKYVAQLTGGKVFLDDVPTPDAIEKVMEGSGRTKEISMRLAVPGAMKVPSRKYAAVLDAAKVADSVGGVSVAITIKVGRKGGFLSNLRDLFEKGRELHQDGVVIGMVAHIAEGDDPDTVRPWDIIMDRLVSRIPVTEKRLSDSAREAVLLRAWEEWRSYLEQNYGPRTSE